MADEPHQPHRVAATTGPGTRSRDELELLRAATERMAGRVRELEQRASEASEELERRATRIADLEPRAAEADRLQGELERLQRALRDERQRLRAIRERRLYRAYARLRRLGRQER